MKAEQEHKFWSERSRVCHPVRCTPVPAGVSESGHRTDKRTVLTDPRVPTVKKELIMMANEWGNQLDWKSHYISLEKI